MIVISDTTPIISLIKAGQLQLLEKMFGTVFIPQAVYKELTTNITFSDEAKIVKSCSFLQTSFLSDRKAINTLQNATGLDSGESEAIILVHEKSADLLLIDEHKGRQTAKKLGIPITGTLGILIQAYNEKYLNASDIEICISRLKECGIRVSEALYQTLHEHIRT